jgi:Tol biopolymer transport system component
MRRFALLLPLAMIAVMVARSLPTSGAPLGVDLVFTQIPFQPRDHERGSSRFLLDRANGQGSRLLWLKTDGSAIVLTSEFSAAADPSVSFDGRKVLFAGRKTASDHWNIWEMDSDGKNKRQLTKDLGDCREPEYLAKSSITPPEFADKVRWIIFASNANDAQTQSALYVTNVEPIQGQGTVVRRATFNLCSDFSPTVLRDGRVIFTSAIGCDGGAAQARFPLLAANWDGSCANLFCGSEQDAPFKTMACETADRNLVFIESGAPSDGGGRLARVAMRRPLHSYELLSRDAGLYLSPRSLPDGRLAVSYTSGKESYGIYLFDFEKGAPGAKVFVDARWESLDVQPLAQRPEPQGLISSVIDSLRWGDLFCLNVYDSDIPGVNRLNKGDVKVVRFFQGAQSEPASRETRLLGEAPVEEDGSFFVHVPADTPLKMQLVGAAGKTLQSMNRWIWVRKGTSQGCVGCHEDREIAPENRAPAAILRGEPYDLFSRK